MQSYPVMLPLDAAQLCIEIVKGRQINERKTEFAHAAWNVQGYAQKMLLGDPSALAQTENLKQVNEKLFELGTTLQEADEEGMMFSAASPEESGSIVVVLTIVATIVQILSSLGLFDRRDNDEAVED